MIWRKILKKRLMTILFYVYIVLLAYFLFFSEYLNRGQLAEEHQINTEIFREIKRYCLHWRTVGLKNFMINMPGNILAFAPFGFFLPYLKKEYRRFWIVALMSFYLVRPLRLYNWLQRLALLMWMIFFLIQ